MVTQIQLGNFFSVNGRTVLGGVGGSGLDTQGLINALAQAKSLPATKLQNTITLNGQKNAALTQFQSLLASLKDAANFLRNPPGVSNEAANAFKYTTATVTSSSSVSGSTYMTVSTTPGSIPQSFTINEITSLARATKQNSEVITVTDANTSVVSATPTGDEFKAGAFTLNDVEITFNAGDSLNTVAAKFNAVKGETGISASVIKVGEGSYQLSFTATQTGTAYDFDFGNVDPAGTLVDPDDVFDNITIADTQDGDATDAVFILNGVEITRSTNTISDVIDNLSFKLLQVTPTDPPATELTVDIVSDEELPKNAIVNFANAYNELKIFVAEQQQINDDGTYAATSILANNSTMRATIGNINAHLASIVEGLTGDNPNRLSELGLTFVDLPESEDTPFVRNIISIDESVLTAALADNFDGVRRVFEFDLISDNPNIKVFSRTNAISITEFTLTANPFATQTTQIMDVASASDPIVFAVPTEGQFGVGTITINGEDIEFEDGDSLDDIAAKFTAVSGTTGLAASVVEDPVGVFKLLFTSTATGAQVNFNLKSEAVDPDGVFDEVEVDVTRIFQAEYDIGNGPETVDFTVATTSGGGYTLTGPAGSVLEGLVLIYGNGTTSVSDVAVTQGIADKVFNTSNDVVKTGGALQVERDSLAASNNKLSAEILRINEQVAKFREQLLIKFAALEQAIARVNNLLQSLDANEQARRNFSS